MSTPPPSPVVRAPRFCFNPGIKLEVPRGMVALHALLASSRGTSFPDSGELALKVCFLTRILSAAVLSKVQELIKISCLNHKFSYVCPNLWVKTLFRRGSSICLPALQGCWEIQMRPLVGKHLEKLKCTAASFKPGLAFAPLLRVKASKQ